MLGASVVAACAEAIADAVNGIGQELFNAAILFSGSRMLGWHNIWMNRHGRELASAAASLGKAVVGGSRPLYALGLVVGIAVLREGSEVVLFLYGIAVASGGRRADRMLVGGIFGAGRRESRSAAADLFRAARGSTLKRLFTVTSWLILLLAAGMASQGAAFLMQANLLPSLGNDLWDTSSILGERSMLGTLLHVLIRLFGAAGRHPGGLFTSRRIVVIGKGQMMRLLATGQPASPVGRGRRRRGG